MELSRDPLDLPRRDLVKLRAVGNGLPAQSSGVFIRASLPRRTGMRDVAGEAGVTRERFVPAPLLALLIGPGLRDRSR